MSITIRMLPRQSRRLYRTNLHTSILLVIMLTLMIQYGFSQTRTVLHLSLDNKQSLKQSGAVSSGFFWFQSGIKGQAMGFDGIQTAVTVPSSKIGDLSGGFTLSASVAMEAYPWTMMAVIDQELKEQGGFYLGIDPEGYPGLWVAAGNKWYSCLSPKKLPLYEWNHLTGTWSPDDGLRLYVNGRELAAVPTSGRFTPASELDVLIGRNHTPRILHEAIRLPAPTKCSLQGLIDEVRIESSVLNASVIADRYSKIRPKGPRPLNPPRLPAGPDGPGNFGASYAR